MASCSTTSLCCRTPSYRPGILLAAIPGTAIKGKSTIFIKSYSAFGQVRWQASEQLELAGGVALAA